VYEHFIVGNPEGLNKYEKEKIVAVKQDYDDKGNVLYEYRVVAYGNVHAIGTPSYKTTQKVAEKTFETIGAAYNKIQALEKGAGQLAKGLEGNAAFKVALEKSNS
jgi:hypothetical protein